MMHFRIYKEICSTDSHNAELAMYGISCYNTVTKKSFIIGDISSDINTVNTLIDLCSQGDVTETTLGYVIEDFIAYV